MLGCISIFTTHLSIFLDHCIKNAKIKNNKNIDPMFCLQRLEKIYHKCRGKNFM